MKKAKLFNKFTHLISQYYQYIQDKTFLVSFKFLKFLEYIYTYINMNVDKIIAMLLKISIFDNINILALLNFKILIKKNKLLSVLYALEKITNNIWGVGLLCTQNLMNNICNS